MAGLRLDISELIECVVELRLGLLVQLARIVQLTCKSKGFVRRCTERGGRTRTESHTLKLVVGSLKLADFAELSLVGQFGLQRARGLHDQPSAGIWIVWGSR
jgi:hypothetical protein